MAILISFTFGVTLFCVILGVWIKARKAARPAAEPENIVEFNAAPAVASPAGTPTGVEAAGQFLEIQGSSELRLPRVAFRHDDGPASLLLGAPLRERIRPMAMPLPYAGFAARVQNIACAQSVSAGAL